MGIDVDGVSGAVVVDLDGVTVLKTTLSSACRGSFSSGHQLGLFCENPSVPSEMRVDDVLVELPGGSPP
jgi:hypothetical protein